MAFAFPDAMSLTEVLSLAVAAVLVNNYILVQFLGCCSFFGVSKKTDTAVGMGMAVIFVMALASAVGCLVLYPQAARSGIYADHRVHSGYRNARTVC